MELYFETHGPAAAPAVVFLHGLGSSGADWPLQIPAFAPRYRLILPDLRAHGRSGGAGTRFGVPDLAADVDELLDRLGVSQAHVVGLSLGAATALALAVRYPGRTRSLVLVNGFARYQPPGLGGLGRTLKRVWLLRFGRMRQVAEFVAAGLFPKPAQRPFYEAAVASLSQNRRETYWAAIRAISSFNDEAQLPRVACPALIIAGDRDRTVPFASQQVLARGIPGARLLVMEDSGHAPPYDQAEKFNQAVLDFVRRTD